MELKDMIAIAVVVVLGITCLCIFLDPGIPMYDADDDRPSDAKPDYKAVGEEAEHPTEREPSLKMPAYDDEGGLYATIQRFEGRADER